MWLILFGVDVDSGRLQFGQVPAMEVREGVMLTQSAAILRFIGKKTDLYPVDDEVAAAVDAIIDQVGKRE